MSVLSSLLARDQAVPVKKIEEAIQRQVISGGDLTTVLLEVGAASENLIASYHATAVDLLPASRDEIMGAPAAAVAALPKALAEQHRVVPIAVEDARITLAGAFVPNDTALAQLAEATGRRVLLRIATEPRIAAALQHHYAITPTARLRRLIQKLDAQPAGDVITVTSLLDNRRDRPSRPPIAPLPELAGATSLRPSAVGSWARVSKAPPGSAEETKVASGNTRSSSSNARSKSQRPPSGAPAAAPAAVSQPVPTPSAAPAVVAVGMQRVVGVSSAKPQASAVSAYARDASSGAANLSTDEEIASAVTVESARPLPAPEPAAQPTPEPAPEAPAPTAALPDVLDAEAAIAALASAQSRDAVIAATFAHCRTHFDYCAIFAAHDEVAEGLDASGGGASRDEVRGISIELDRPGTARDVRQLLGPKAGVLDATEADRDLAQRLDRTAKQPSVLIPVAIRQRLVLLVYGDRGGQPLGLSDLGELLSFLPRVSDALQRLILNRKRRGEARAIGSDGSSFPAPPKEWARAASAPAEEPPPSEPAAPEAPAAEAAAPEAPAPDERPREFDLLGVPRKAPRPPELGDQPRSSVPSRPSEQLLGRDSSRPSWQPGKPVTDTSYRAAGVTEEVVLTRKRGGRRSVAPSKPAADNAVAVAPAVALRAPQLPVEASSIADAVTPMPVERPGGVSLPPRTGEPSSSTPPERPPVSTPAPAASPAPVSATAFDDDEDEPEISVSEAPTPTADSGATIITNLGLDLDELVDGLIAADRDAFDARLGELLQFGEPALRVLVRRFPGPLWIPGRPGPEGPHPRARDVGPVPRALVGFRPHATANVATLLDSRDAEIRYFAVLVAAEMPHRDLVGRIGRRVLDDDAGVRSAAVVALRAFRRFEDEVAEVLAHFRRVAGNDRAPAALREQAIELLGELRDGEAATLLVDLLGAPEAEIARRSHRALQRITKQVFGPSSAAWEPWLREHGEAHRIEWLIDALLSEDETLRREAGEELKTLTQEYFGFQSALPRKEREVVQRKYRKWWDTHGRARFVRA